MITPLLPSTTYHLYNRANGDENLFRERANYLYFLRKYAEYISPVAATYAYCLMPNHFHLMLRIRAEEELFEVIKRKREAKNLQGLQDLGGLSYEACSKAVSQQFSNFFNAYTKAFNKKYGRSGSLFSPNFKRKPVENDSYFTTLVRYIHFNPVHHGFCTEPLDWEHSSLHLLLAEKPTKLERDEVLEWFGGREQTKVFHEREPNSRMPKELELE
jgi:REP element-mobilizing transposase RayT